ncbi:MAG: bacteriohopanetetrol glucosamine biosynthesis glycosyltransferase HpnI [Bryobacteraceae bacterium]|nr:bacteriohopanetetrol glucosamine biosynthesis glycosyltransferase HpnI [Bryobacteraceae bacterium]
MALVPLMLLLALAGSLVYCVLVLYAAHHYRSERRAPPGQPVPISVLKPLAGVDEGLEENLRSFFEQDYPEYELLFAVRSTEDPAIGVVERLRREYAGIPSRLIVTGEPPYPNAKVFSLRHMIEAARHELLVMSDSDVRVTPEMLRVVAAEFQDPRLGLTTCPYRAVPGPSLWSRLEAIGMNTEFLAGILTARLMEGMRFAVGPTTAARRPALDAIGGIERVKDYLAEDFMLGKLVHEAGWRVGLSSYVIEHRIGSQNLAQNLRHRLRWARSTRRSRPGGYIGQLFTYPLPLGLLLFAIRPEWWPMLVAAAGFRALAAWATAGFILRDRLTGRYWWLVPVQDLLAFVLWIAGFFGNTILWRGRRYRLHADGRFTLVQ